jgi:polysaccharide biosynthesis protein PslG
VRIRIFVAAVLVTVLGLGVLAGPAAAVSRQFFGVISTEQPSDSEFNTMGRGRVGTLRMLLYWATVEPNRGERDWALYDKLISNASAQGIRLLPVLFGSPSFAAQFATRPPVTPSARQAWASFVADAVNRYKPGGAFWQTAEWKIFSATHGNAPPMPITDWQLWNEQNSPSYWLPRVRAKSYGSFLKLSGAALHAADPQGHLVLGGMFTRPVQRRAVPLEKYIDDLYKVKKVKRAFDALAVHSYSTKPSGALKTVKSVRKVTKKNGDGGTPIWITEMGWASSGTPSRYTTTTEGQAQKLEASFSSLAANAGRLGIPTIIWYSFRDASPGGYWLNRTGLFELNGTPKPAWNSYVRFTGGQP